MSFTAGQGRQEHRLGDRYRLVDEIGRGGMGRVWQAFDELLQRNVAIKVLDPSQSPVEHGRVEALALAQLSHPNIASVFDYGEDDGRPYVVMELVRGQSLAAILARGRLAWAPATAAVAQVASALAAAHERGLVHRDVKPGNIMVTPVGAKLIDFGISAVEGEAEAESNGELRGTPVYVAPERLRGHAVAAPTDVYALGVVLYRALSGHLPWPAGDAGEYWEQRERSDPTPLPLTDGLPASVADLCLQSLTADPTQRPDAATMAAVLSDATGPDGFRELELLAAPGQGAGEATQLMAPLSLGDSPRGRHPTRTKVGAVAALVAALALAWSSTYMTTLGDDTALPATVNPAPLAPACDVTFSVAADAGQRFAADIVAIPRTEAFRSGWRLSIPLASTDMDVDQESGWTRDGTVITSPAQPTAAVGSPVQLALAGTHTGAIALPRTIEVDGRECALDLSASVLAAGPTPAEATDQPSNARHATPGQRIKPGTGAGNAHGVGNGPGRNSSTVTGTESEAGTGRGTGDGDDDE
jgi:serine/threonine-protein kinase